jgi:hypothetical protein
MIDLAIAIENADAKSHVQDMLEAAATAIGSQTGVNISRAVDLGQEPKQVLD